MSCNDCALKDISITYLKRKLRRAKETLAVCAKGVTFFEYSKENISEEKTLITPESSLARFTLEELERS